jgi:hypothetical protein
VTQDVLLSWNICSELAVDIGQDRRCRHPGQIPIGGPAAYLVANRRILPRLVYGMGRRGRNYPSTKPIFEAMGGGGNERWRYDI